ncbi:hypothetical protein BHE74_00013435 [Ensete ventricosum]|nr:hypothetical protein BHE74_00013435 [Ensete ventricosum]
MEEEGSGEEGRLEAAAAATAREGKRAGRRKEPVQQRRAWLRQRHLRQREEKAEEGLAAATKCLAAIEAAGKRRQRPELAGIAGGWLRQRETEEEGWAAAAEGTTVLAVRLHDAYCDLLQIFVLSSASKSSVLISCSVVMFLSDMSGRSPLYKNSPVNKELVAHIKKDTSVLPRVGGLSEVELNSFTYST